MLNADAMRAGGSLEGRPATDHRVVRLRRWMSGLVSEEE